MALVGLSEIRTGIDQELSRFVAARCQSLTQIDEHLKPVAESLSEYILSGGKRFRPIFAYLGYLAADGSASPEALRACSALELVHVCALIHDDLMDGSDSRRNQPAIHRQFEAMHHHANYSGLAERFGSSAAILLGDLALSWSDWALAISGINSAALERATPVFQAMREELMAGQYLDVLEGSIAKSDQDRSMKIANLKSGKYSIERPLHFGAALAGADTAIFNIYTNFGLPLGQAFQLRDDLLGVFGDSQITGKPSGDDIREGKRTVLIAMAMARTTDVGRELISNSLGNPELSETEITRIQELIEGSGAKMASERLIGELFQKALDSLSSPLLNPGISTMLREMAVMATQRSS